MTSVASNQTLNAKDFVDQLVREIHELFAQLGEHETLESESDGQVDVVPLLKLALTSELEAAEIAAHWLPDTADIEAKTILAEQCSDELNHYNMIMDRLNELGEDMSGFDPLAEGYSPPFPLPTLLVDDRRADCRRSIRLRSRRRGAQRAIYRFLPLGQR